MWTLFVCATPIGNLEDITLRAVRVLREAPLIICEDTRHTKILLNKYDIKSSLVSYHKFTTPQKVAALIERIKTSGTAALVTDAGMPGISDPGYDLIREALAAGINIVPIPGPSAVITALAISGIATGKFVFEGFLPNKQGERTSRLKLLAGEERTIALYESPLRVKALLKDILSVMGDRNIAICRELTKKFEEVIRGKVSEVLAGPSLLAPKGEFVVVIDGARGRTAGESSFDPGALIGALTAKGMTKKDIVSVISSSSNLTRNELYDIVLNAGKVPSL